MNEKDKKTRLYAPSKQGVSDKKEKPPASTSQFMPLDEKRLYSPSRKTHLRPNQKSAERRANDNRNKPTTFRKDSTSVKNKNSRSAAKFVAGKQPAKSTRLVMPLDENRSYKPSVKHKPDSDSAKLKAIDRQKGVADKNPAPAHKKNATIKKNAHARQKPSVSASGKKPKTHIIASKEKIAPKNERTSSAADAQSLRIKHERAQRRRYILALCTAFTGVIVCILMLTGYVFNVRRITVVGAMRYDEDYIISVSGIKRGDNLLFKNIDDAAANLNADPYIDAVVQKKFPNEVVIIVTESNERAYIESLDTRAVIDSAGVVLSIDSDDKIPVGLLRIEGIGMTGLRVGSCLNDLLDYRSRVLMTLIAAIDEANMSADIVSVDLTNPFSVYIKTANLIRVYIGDTENLAAKLENLMPMCEELISRGYGKGILDLSRADAPSYIRHDSEMPEITDAPLNTTEASNPPGIVENTDESPSDSTVQPTNEPATAEPTATQDTEISHEPTTEPTIELTTEP